MEFDRNETDETWTPAFEVGEYDHWKLSACPAGLLFEPATRAFGSPRRTSRGIVETSLDSIVRQAFGDRDASQTRIPFDAFVSLSPEERDFERRFASALPGRIQLDHRNNLGHAEFSLSPQIKMGGKRVHPQVVGIYARLDGSVYRLADKDWALMQSVSELNSLPSDEKTDLPRVLRAWARVERLARSAGAELDPYLAGENVVVPSRVSLDVHEDGGGNASIVPTFDGVPSDTTHRAYLRENLTQQIYNLDADGGRTRIVLDEPIQAALEAIRPYRQLDAREQARVFSNPLEILPDGIDTSVIDLSLFGPRVRAIGAYPTTVRAFERAPRPWIDGVEVGPDDTPPSQDVDAQSTVGVTLETDDGDVRTITFEEPEDVEGAIDRARTAHESGDETVTIEGEECPVSSALIRALEQALDRIRRQENPPPSRRPSGELVGPLVFENAEDRDYEEESRQRDASSPRVHPGALSEGVQLKPHQQVGVDWLATIVSSGDRGALLADDMGLGKTLQALTFLAWLIETDALGTGLSNAEAPWRPILVVCPPILLDVWRREIPQFFDDSIFLPYEILDSPALRRFRREEGKEGKVARSVLDLDAIRRHRLVISNYDAVANYGFSFAQIQWSAVVTDEAHHYKEPSTRISQVMKSLNTEFRLALTGTPVVNRLLDVWNIVDFLRPLHLGSQKEFRDEFELQDEDGGSIEGARRLRDRLRVATSRPEGARCVVLRRSKEQELQDLPAKSEHRIDVALTDLQKGTYRQLRAAILENSGQGAMLKLLSSLNRLLQHPALEGLIPLEAPVGELIDSSPKLQSLIEELERVRARGEKALVFAIYCNMQLILKRAIDDQFGLNTTIINGQNSSSGKRVRERRRTLIDEFSGTDGFDVMILSPDVAGVGLTITAANHVFHYGRWWNPAREDQATDRTYRIGQDKDVHVYRLVARDEEGGFRTFDEHLDDLISERRRTAEQFLVPSVDESDAAAGLIGRVLDEDFGGPAVESLPIDSSSQLSDMSPDRFEAFVAAWYRAQGHEVVLTPYSGDGGIDVLAVKNGRISFIQVKHVGKPDRRIPDDAVNQVRNGASHYLSTYIPDGHSRSYSLVVATNGRASRLLKKSAVEHEVELIRGRDLVRSLRRSPIEAGEPTRLELSRLGSLEELTERVVPLLRQTT